MSLRAIVEDRLELTVREVAAISRSGSFGVVTCNAVYRVEKRWMRPIWIILR